MKFITRLFHSTTMNMRKWTAEEIETLSSRVNSLGPAWSICSWSLPGRSPEECKRQHAKAVAANSNNEMEKSLILQGFENFDGNPDSSWYHVPIEESGFSSFDHLARQVKTYKFRSEKKAKGWSNEELLALREGYELLGPQWKKIAKKLQYRTANQCEKMLLKQTIHMK